MAEVPQEEAEGEEERRAPGLSFLLFKGERRFECLRERERERQREREREREKEKEREGEKEREREGFIEDSIQWSSVSIGVCRGAFF